MKSFVYVPVLLVSLSAGSVFAEEQVPEVKKEEIKQESGYLSRYLTNYKGIYTGVIGIAAAVNTLIRAKQLNDVHNNTRISPKVRYEDMLNLLTAFLAMSFVSYLAFEKSAESWRQIK